MKRIIWILVAVLSIGSAIVFVPWDLAYAYMAPLPDTVQGEVDQAVQNRLDGVVVYVDRKGQPPAFYAAGWKNKETRVAADPHAFFRIGSVSKMYMVAATTKLVAAHRLSLDDTLAHLLPELAGHIANADRITLRMMIRHRSGIHNYVEDSRFRWDKYGHPDEALSLVLDRRADFEPDSSYHYSNTNYLLLGRILDRTLGYKYDDYVSAEILAPLHLTHTFGQLDDVNAADVMSGYDLDYPGDMKPLSLTSPGGSMVATADDVGTFLRALNTGTLLTPEEQAIYTSLYPYEHTGLLPGYETIARYHKDIDTVVIVFVNTTGRNSWGKIEAVESRVNRILHKEKQ
ncbi:serine hydrolase domain-containing protein [Asticcacaulis solisilvae]|uniref:serine hydrolase domain-containing protein n=1 Tax=Asticcacaulis solisilvae TaxID=1217274 RepID=UPI003FD77575